MRYLKKNTDSYVTVGPFIDKTDGFTLKDDLTVTNIKGIITRETQVAAATDSDEFTCTATAANDYGLAGHGHGGLYQLKIPDSDINFVGSCTLCLYYATAYLPVFHEFMIVPANVWDSMMGTDYLDVSAVQFAGQTITCAAGVTVRADVGAAAAPGAANGMLIAGANLATTFATLTSTGALTAGSMAVTGALTVGDGIVVTCSTDSKSAIKATGGATAGVGVEIIGTGAPGLKTTGGAASAGILATGGSTSGPGISAIGTGSGDGLYCKGGATGDGIQGLGGSSSGHGMHLSQVGDTGSGLEIETANDGNAIKATAKGTGHGMFLQSGDGATGNGLHAIALSTNGRGIYAKGLGSGDGLYAEGGPTGDGIQGKGGTNGHGIHATGTGTGNGILADAAGGAGIKATGTGAFAGIDATGGTNIAGILATGGATNAPGINAVGTGTGSGIRAVSGTGATGDGITATALSTAGNGMALLGTTTGNGLRTEGGVGAGGDGIEAVAGGGVPIRGDITGNVTGTVATVTTLTNAVTLANGAHGGAAATLTLNGAAGLVATKIDAPINGAITGNITGNLVGTVSTLTTYTGNTPQTGDAYAALTAAQAEPAQGAPAANASVVSKIAYLYKAWRNKKTQTANTFALFNDAKDTVDQKAAVSDAAGTLTVDEIASGP